MTGNKTPDQHIGGDALLEAVRAEVGPPGRFQVVLLNDDCVCDPAFVERLIAPLDPATGVVMTSGVLRDWRHPELLAAQ